MTSKAFCIAALAASAVLSGCDYCPRPGVLELTPQFYRPRTPAYPVPKVTECGIEPGPCIHGKPVGSGHQASLDLGLANNSSGL